MTVDHDFDFELASGRYLDVLDPRPEQITLEDVAAGLSKTCRFGGQCRRFYSVAEHALLVAERLDREGHGAATQLAGLHHDDHEALGLCDLPRPFKRLFPEYPEVAATVQNALMEALGLPLAARSTESAVIKAADNWALMQEAGELLPSGGKNWNAFGDQWDKTFRYLGARDYHVVRSNWLQQHRYLMRQVGR